MDNPPSTTEPTDASGGAIGRDDPWDTLHGPSLARLHWATSNLGEAMPGVQTPLSWSMWADATEHAPREAAYRIGGLARSERSVPARTEDRFVRAFFGRPAIQVEFFALLGDRMPGTTGSETAKSVLGSAPEDIDYAPTMRRYPVIAWRLPWTFARTPGQLRAFAAEQDEWYQRQMARIAGLDHASAVALLREAADRHDAALVIQTTGILGVIQPLHDAIVRLVEQIGAGRISALTGAPGGAEMAVVSDLWKASRGQLDVDEVVRRHGFHGPAEGELSSRVWREDPSPVRAMVESYGRLDESADPLVRDAERRRERPAVERELIDAAPAWQRPAVRLLLGLARDRLPLRGVAKRSFLQAFDVARAVSRRIGEQLVDAGKLDEPDDVFYLTLTELTGVLPGDPKRLVSLRRERRAAYAQLTVPDAWQGNPPAVVSSTAAIDGVSQDAGPVTGVGVSAGIVEGIVRVLHDPDFGDVEPDEILVTPTTDPSWSSVMFISAALVVDIGGALSHAAVVARELEIPCVVNTRTGTRVLQTGDRVRVDGSAGTVEILSRAGS